MERALRAVDTVLGASHDWCDLVLRRVAQSVVTVGISVAGVYFVGVGRSS